MTTVYEAEEVRVAGNTDVYIGDLDATFPTDLDSEPGEGWTHLGYTTENGVKPGLKRTIFEARASQAFRPIRRVVTGIDQTVEFELMQWNSDTVLLAFGGGEVTDIGGGLFKYTPPADSFIDEHKVLLHTVDGDVTYRWGYERAQNTRDFQSDFTRTNVATLPIGMVVTDPGDEDAFFFITDDPAFEATAS